MDPLAVQGALKSLLQHHNLKASALQRSAVFMVQLSHWYMTTGKTTALLYGEHQQLNGRTDVEAEIPILWPPYAKI